MGHFSVAVQLQAQLAVMQRSCRLGFHRQTSADRHPLLISHNIHYAHLEWAARNDQIHRREVSPVARGIACEYRPLGNGCVSTDKEVRQHVGL